MTEYCHRCKRPTWHIWRHLCGVRHWVCVIRGCVWDVDFEEE